MRLLLSALPADTAAQDAAALAAAVSDLGALYNWPVHFEVTRV